MESAASLFCWNLHKADVKFSFLQTKSSNRYVFVKPPGEFGMKSKHFWVLQTAAHGLMNSNDDWQVQLNEVLFNSGVVFCDVGCSLFIVAW